jgi:ribosomal protein S18 acetylase RimI-like enzyme
MTSNPKHINGELGYRSARPSDAALASELIFATFPEMATFIIGLGDELRAKENLACIFPLEGHSFSYSMTTLVFNEAGVVGLFIAFPGWMESLLNRRLAKVLLSQFNFWEKLQVILRGVQLMFIKEAERDEFLLSNLAVVKHARGQGIGTQILADVEERAKQAGLTKVALLVSVDNHGARQLYERMGYAGKNVYNFGNHLFPDIGPGFQRLVKVLIE